MRRAWWVNLSIITLLISGCGTTTTPANTTDNQSYQIVTSTSILADMTSNIVGDAARVTSLVGAESDAHVYEPSPADGVTVAEASALIAHGLAFEPWFEELYAASGSNAPYIEASADVTPHATDNAEAHTDELAPESGDTHADEQGDTHADEHAHGEYDPHVWQDVQNAIKMVTHISSELLVIMPEHADRIRANTATYIATLEALDNEIVATVARIPDAQRILVTNHDTLSYFAERYGFRVVGTVLGSVSTESSDPSADEIADLVMRIKESGAPAIFVEAFGNADIITTIANEAGVTVAPALYTDALGAQGSPGHTYVDMMRYNSQTIAQALGATANQ